VSRQAAQAANQTPHPALPAHPVARRFWLALNLHLAGAGERAALGLRVALAGKPDFEALAQCLWLLRQHGSTIEAALLMLDRVPPLLPGNADAHFARGDALFSLDRFAEAVASYDRAITLEPRHVEAYVNRGRALSRAGDDEAALASHDRALAIAPDHVSATRDRGIALHGLDRFAEALDCFDRVVAARPNDPSAHSNRGAALSSLDRMDAALACYQRANAIDPDFLDAYVNHGLALNRVGRFDAALDCFERVLAVRPDDANVHLAAAEARLALGDFAAGWPEYEWRRLTRAPADRPDEPQPQWRGEDDLAGRTILLSSEQGLGDTLQFCRYAPLVGRTLVGRRARLVLEVPASLVRLLSTLAGDARIVAKGDPLPPVDVRCPLVSLPLAFGTRLQNIPAEVPYLHADPDQVSRWRERLAPLPGRRVGLVWAGDPRPEDRSARVIDRRRSITLAHYAPLGRIPGVSLVSLQKGEAAQQTGAPPAGMTIHDWTDELEDFADTAALVAALDLVISVDTSVVHLTGALGQPIWVLNRFDTCWRWFRTGAGSLWYPTARLFRQPSAGDWDTVITEVAAALRDFAPSDAQVSLP
jgi:tetratricopeptide (TPR) repeat protein